MDKIVLNVMGMSCAHCEKAIKKAVSVLDGVSKVDADLPAKKVIIEYLAGRSTPDDFKTAIEDQGCDVV